MALAARDRSRMASEQSETSMNAGSSDGVDELHPRRSLGDIGWGLVALAVCVGPVVAAIVFMGSGVMLAVAQRYRLPITMVSIAILVHSGSFSNMAGSQRSSWLLEKRTSWIPTATVLRREVTASAPYFLGLPVAWLRHWLVFCTSSPW